MKWAISLILSDNEIIERRLEKIVSYVIMNNQIEHIFLYDIDATGYMGNQMTQRLNVVKEMFKIGDNDLSALITEEGQIFELDLILKNSHEYRFIVRDGCFLDIVSDGPQLPDLILGLYEELDINLYL
jgi:hypothetical protein